MEYKFGILFRIQSLHSYFSEGLARGLAYRPTASANQILSRYNARFQPITGGFRIVCPVSDEHPSMIQPKLTIPPGTCFSLMMEAEDPYFLNYTNLPALAAGKILYTNNLNTRKKVAKLRQMDVRPSRFNLDISNEFGPKPGAERLLQISKLNGMVVWEQTVFKNPADPNCQVNLTDFAAGAFTLTVTIAGQSHSYSFFMNPDPINQSVLGFFEWFALRAPGVFNNAVTGEPQHFIKFGESYCIELKSRETHWKYFLIRVSHSELTNPNIAYYLQKQKLFDFVQSPNKVTLPNGREALEFVASKTLPYQEHPAGEVILEAVGFSNEFQLPFASPGGYAPSPGTSQDKSNIYIYL